MPQTQFIDRCSQPDQLNWQGVIDALIAGHQLPRAAITDTVLADGTNRLLNRSARIEGLGYVVKSVTVFPKRPAREQFLPSLQGICTVFDECTGQARALIDAELLTGKRPPKVCLGLGCWARQNPNTCSSSGQVGWPDH